MFFQVQSEKAQNGEPLVKPRMPARMLKNRRYQGEVYEFVMLDMHHVAFTVAYIIVLLVFSLNSGAYSLPPSGQFYFGSILGLGLIPVLFNIVYSWKISGKFRDELLVYPVFSQNSAPEFQAVVRQHPMLAWGKGSTREDAIVDFLRNALPYGYPAEGQTYVIVNFTSKPKSLK